MPAVHKTTNEMESARTVNDIRKHVRDDIATLARPRLPNQVLLSSGESGTSRLVPAFATTSLSDSCTFSPRSLLSLPSRRSRVINVFLLVSSQNDIVFFYDCEQHWYHINCTVFFINLAKTTINNSYYSFL